MYHNGSNYFQNYLDLDSTIKRIPAIRIKRKSMKRPMTLELIKTNSRKHIIGVRNR
jgi:hypothetical protein